MFHSDSYSYHAPEQAHSLLQKLTHDEIEVLLMEAAEPQGLKEKNKILCATCGYEVTARQYEIDIQGQHTHIVTNPSGFIFKIGCFSLANGCTHHGIPTLEHTWFHGFTWNFVLCGQCTIHLGWFYQKNGDSSFYGLILDRLQFW